MHSKVIIASLACILAVNLNIGRSITSNSVEKGVEPVAQETTQHAPNDFPRHISISSEDGMAGDSFSATINYEREYPGFQVLEKSTELSVSYHSYEFYADTYITTPTSSGTYFVKFGYYSESRQVVLASIYIYSDGNYYCASSKSIYEAKSRFFHYHRATYEENEYISYRDNFHYNGYYYDADYNAYDPYRFSAEARCANFVYGGSNDVSVDFLPFGVGSSSVIYLKLHATWIDSNNHYHPLAGVRADFIAQNSLLGQGNSDLHFTDNDGEYTVTLPKSQTNGLLVNDIKCRVSAVTEATSVEDSFYQNYPICYTAPYGTSLTNYSELDIFIYVYAARSDRGSAYEIAQAQETPYFYAVEYNHFFDTIITRFPSESTSFNYFYGTRFIDVQEEDAHNWDALHHEYGHYICDQLNLCYIESSNYYHGVHEDLGKYNEYRALSEGLATYFGIAAQMYNVTSVTNISGFGDEIYQDPYRDFSVNYNYFAPGGITSPFYGERVESSVTSILIKMLDDVSRSGDDVALGDGRMWNIFNHLSCCDNIVDIIDKAINLYPSYASYIANLRHHELIAEVDVNVSPTAEWTIMLYIDGCDLESGAKKSDGSWESSTPSGYASLDIEEILKVKNKPSNVNILIETGGSERWKNPNIVPNRICRFTVEKQSDNTSVLQLRQNLANSNMGLQSTFDSFLNWGFRNYPAKKTGVILWNHGGGFECCDGLTNREVANSFENAFYQNRLDNTKIEFIGYDACLMQLQDVADFNSPYCKYMIGSEQTEPATGWVYDKWIDDVYANKSTINILKEIADTYISDVGDANTLSVLDLSRVANYRTHFETVANALSTVPCEMVFQIATAAYRFSFNGKNNGTIDGLDFLKRLLANGGLMDMNGLRAKVNNAISAYNQVVKYNKTGRSANGKANGMSIHYAGAKKGAQAAYNFAVSAGIYPQIMLSMLAAAINNYETPYYPKWLTNFTNWRSLCY